MDVSVWKSDFQCVLENSRSMHQDLQVFLVTLAKLFRVKYWIFCLEQLSAPYWFSTCIFLSLKGNYQRVNIKTKKEKLVCKLCGSKWYMQMFFVLVILLGNVLVGNTFFHFEVQAQTVCVTLILFLIVSRYLCQFQGHNRVNYFLKDLFNAYPRTSASIFTSFDYGDFFYFSS